MPKAGTAVAEHFVHTYALAAELARLVPTAVIVERIAGDPPAALAGVRTFTQRRAEDGFPRRQIELARLLLKLRRSGFRHFFVRTSTTAAIPTLLAMRPLGGRVAYWNCGSPERHGVFDRGARHGLRHELPLRAALRLSSFAVTGTPRLAHKYVAAYGVSPRRVWVLPNEVALARYSPPTAAERLAARARIGASEADRVALTVHRLSPVRRTLLYVPETLEAAIAESPNARFWIVGGGPEEQAVRDAVARAGLAERVTCLGELPHAQLADFYRAADAFFMPSFTEGFPRVLLEAMALGLPIASTDVGGVREILPPVYEQHLVARDDAAGLGRAIARLLNDEALRSRMRAEGLDRVKSYDAPVVARQLVELMHTARKGAPAAAR